MKINFDLLFKNWLSSINMTLSEQHIDYIKNFFSGRPVKKAYIFGSYSRDEADENSDIDILVELDHIRPIGMKFFSYKDELEQILQKKVDLVSDEGLSKYVKPFVDKVKVLIYER
ncbi:nucleotidyltransferase family protein [Pedobacter sp. L105]|uniref:nucleotidyltransferase family protein n=1 Tax=Pedobacter sp. L105 TaxID=1641871 RepID=UPI001C205D96|nr:nucleotidyltransferase domain-containing protein [Pedobacter sp. L105]